MLARTLHAELQQAVEDEKESERRAAEERERLRQLEGVISTAEAAPSPDTAIRSCGMSWRAIPAMAGRSVCWTGADRAREARLEERQQKITAARGGLRSS